MKKTLSLLAFLLFVLSFLSPVYADSHEKKADVEATTIKAEKSTETKEATDESKSDADKKDDESSEKKKKKEGAEEEEEEPDCE